MTDWDFNGEGVMMLVDKPLDWTSFDVVHKIKVLFHANRVGHAGTLDPRATGLLIVCTGKKTKSIDEYVAEEKEYTGTLELGITTPSFDSETEVSERKEYSTLTLQQVEDAFNDFRGIQDQTPPMYSAVKLRGKPLYKYARKGRTVERASRMVDVRALEITAFNLPLVEFRVVCSKGTYVRSLVNDIGAQLACGAVLRALRRTRIGNFSVNDARTIEELIELKQSLILAGTMYDYRSAALGTLV
jgi:tRNA pseudouridine55 synthase